MLKIFIVKYKYYILLSLLFIVAIPIIFLNQKDNNTKPVTLNSKKTIIEDNIDESSLETISVDIKGAVKKPGVYKVVKGSIVNDVIEFAGGLKSGATTNNLNLSKKVSDEMVIYIYTKSELNKQSTENSTKISECAVNNTPDISSCTNTSKSSIIVTNDPENTDISTDDNSTTNNLININTASKEQLMTLSGIGESKALNIIEYRNTNGLFNCIEDIKNISGIGDALFEKIKDSITV